MAISDYIINALPQGLDILVYMSSWILLRLLVLVALASGFICDGIITIAHFGKWLFAPPFLIALTFSMPFLAFFVFALHIWEQVDSKQNWHWPSIWQALVYARDTCAESWEYCINRSFGEVTDGNVDLKPLNTTRKSSGANPPLPKVMEITKSRAQKIRREGVHGGTFFSPGVDTERREATEYPGMEMRGGVHDRPKPLKLTKPSKLRD